MNARVMSKCVCPPPARSPLPFFPRWLWSGPYSLSLASTRSHTHLLSRLPTHAFNPPTPSPPHIQTSTRPPPAQLKITKIAQDIVRAQARLVIVSAPWGSADKTFTKRLTTQVSWREASWCELV
jgi:hypothetical protein